MLKEYNFPVGTRGKYAKRYTQGIKSVEVRSIRKRGVWIMVGGKEYFLPYSEYPRFKKAKIAEIYNVKLVNNLHLYWPALDVDLEVSSLANPEKYPLVYH